MKAKFIIYLFIVISGVFSCTKDNPTPPVKSTKAVTHLKDATLDKVDSVTSRVIDRFNQSGSDITPALSKMGNPNEIQNYLITHLTIAEDGSILRFEIPDKEGKLESEDVLKICEIITGIPGYLVKAGEKDLLLYHNPWENPTVVYTQGKLKGGHLVIVSGSILT